MCFPLFFSDAVAIISGLQRRKWEAELTRTKETRIPLWFIKQSCSAESTLAICPPTSDSALSASHGCHRKLTVVQDATATTGYRWSMVAQQHVMADCGFDGVWCCWSVRESFHPQGAVMFTYDLPLCRNINESMKSWNISHHKHNQGLINVLFFCGTTSLVPCTDPAFLFTYFGHRNSSCRYF